MNIFEVKDRTQSLIQHELLELWEDSVTATHLFLSSNEIKSIKEYVPQALKLIQHLIILIDDNNVLIGFMGINEKRLEMLFIKSSKLKKGFGRTLLMYGIEKYNINELTVNEENPNARKFYEHRGFKIYQRKELDGQGNKHPILYMKLIMNDD